MVTGCTFYHVTELCNCHRSIGTYEASIFLSQFSVPYFEEESRSGEACKQASHLSTQRSSYLPILTVYLWKLSFNSSRGSVLPCIFASSVNSLSDGVSYFSTMVRVSCFVKHFPCDWCSLPANQTPTVRSCMETLLTTWGFWSYQILLLWPFMFVLNAPIPDVRRTYDFVLYLCPGLILVVENVSTVVCIVLWHDTCFFYKTSSYFFPWCKIHRNTADNALFNWIHSASMLRLFDIHI